MSLGITFLFQSVANVGIMRIHHHIPIPPQDSCRRNTASRFISYHFLVSRVRYPSLRVAYVDEIEVTSEDKSKRTLDKVYYSTLVKALPKSVDSSEVDQVHIPAEIGLGQSTYYG